MVAGVESYCSCGAAALGGPSELAPALTAEAEDDWSWDAREKSSEVLLYGSGGRTAMFHPGWSNGTAAVKGTKALNGTRSFWEIELSHRVFGTSISFGVSAKATRNFRNQFMNLVGSDDLSWGLSHKGILWHNGEYRQFTKPFAENTATKIGILFDGFEGTLRFFKDNEDLGVAFRGLHKVPFPLYPIISSTAARSELRLASRYRLGFPSLENLCMHVLAEHASLRPNSDSQFVHALPLPNPLKAALQARLARPSPPQRLPCPLEKQPSRF